MISLENGPGRRGLDEEEEVHSQQPHEHNPEIASRS